MISDIPPIGGVPVQLITAINERLRTLSGNISSSSSSTSGNVRASEGKLANRPNLTSSDAGSLYFTDDTYQVFWWDGKTWSEITPANDVQVAVGSGDLTLVAVTYNDVPGCTLTLKRSGRYLITGCFDFKGLNALDVNCAANGRLMANGAAQSVTAQFQMLVLTGAGLTSSPVQQESTITQQWLFTATAPNQVVKLQAQKSAGTGGSKVVGTQSTISAVWISL